MRIRVTDREDPRGTSKGPRPKEKSQTTHLVCDRSNGIYPRVAARSRNETANGRGSPIPICVRGCKSSGCGKVYRGRILPVDLQPCVIDINAAAFEM